MFKELSRVLDRHDWLRSAVQLHHNKGRLTPTGYRLLMAPLDQGWIDDPDYLGTHTHRVYLAEFSLKGDRWLYSGAVAFEDAHIEYAFRFMRNGSSVNVREFRALQDSLPIGKTHTERLSSGL